MPCAILTIANAGKGFSYPAKQGDGTSTNPNAPLEGQWFRIDPKIDLNKLNLRPFTLLVAKAVQKYGGYAADKNLFCHTFTAEHPINEWYKESLTLGKRRGYL